MSPSFRIIVGFVAAMAVAVGMVWLLEQFSATNVVPFPAGIDRTDPQAVRKAIEAGMVPYSVLVIVVAGWLLAAYTGGRVAWRMSEHSVTVWAFAIVFTGLLIWMLSQLPYPTWMWIAGGVGAPLFALGGGRRSGVAIR